jgi:hypothetical protein
VCKRCSKSDKVLLRRQIAANGSTQWFYYCAACEQYAEPGHWLPAAMVIDALTQRGHVVDDVPILHNYTTGSQPCAVCGNQDTEYNHWLPQMLADKPDVRDEWAAWSQQGAYLCRRHHNLWHNLVTPWMPGRGVTR